MYLKYANIFSNKLNILAYYLTGRRCEMNKVNIELELEEIDVIENLIKSRINELRDKMSNDMEREEELKQIIRYYKQIIRNLDDQIK
jgi:hypothetical protein